LLVPLALYLVPDTIRLPRSVFVLGWLTTSLAAALARAWSTLWRRVVIDEASQTPNAKRDEKRVLLIGGAGYIGSALIPKLLEAGYRVRLLDLFLYGKKPLEGCLEHPNLELLTGDFRQIERVVSAMKGVSSVIHLGGLVGDPACAVDEQLTIEINLVATRVIAEVARGEGVRRFVFASTCSVYGASDGILDENSKLNPVSLYARSKIASEHVLQNARSDGFSPVILRFGTIFGLSGRTRFDLVVNLLSAKAVFDGKITLYGGDQWRPFLHVDDAAQAVLAALEAPIDRVDGEVFNIGGDELNYTLRQVGELIHQIVPSADLLDFGANADRRNYRVDFSKVRKRLGFKPRWTLAEGVSQVIESIRSGQVQDYTQAEYSNVKFLSDEKIRVLGKDGGWEKRVLEGSGPSEEAITRP
jgi:nucleoside-diphosphate-sugar epimerase